MIIYKKFFHIMMKISAKQIIKKYAIFSAIDKNAKSYKTSFTHKSLKIFFNQKKIKTVIFKYLTWHKINLLVIDKKIQLFNQKDNDKDFYTSFWNKYNYLIAR